MATLRRDMENKEKYVGFIAQHMSSLFQFVTLRATIFKDEKVVL